MTVESYFRNSQEELLSIRTQVEELEKNPKEEAAEKLVDQLTQLARKNHHPKDLKPELCEKLL